MPASTLAYPFHNRYVDHWLLVGPHVTPSTPESTISPQVVSAQPRHLAEFVVDDATLHWRYERSLADHFVHLSATYPTRCFVRSWLYSQIVSSAALTTEAILTAHGAAIVWHNGQIVYDQRDVSPNVAHQGRFVISLRAGPNDLLIQCAQPAHGDCAQRIALQLPALAAKHDVQIHLPTAMAHRRRFQQFEALFEQAFIDRDLFIGADEVQIHWADDLPTDDKFLLRLQQPPGRIYAETLGAPRANGVTKTVAVTTLTSAPYQLVLMPPPPEYAQHQVRIQRTVDLHVLNQHPVPIGAAPSGETYLTRLAEAVQLAMRQPLGLLSEIAAMKLGAWRMLNTAPITAALAAIARQDAGYERDAVGLLGALEKYGGQPAFPAELKVQIDHAIAGMDAPATSARSEADELLALTAHVLVGQRYPLRSFRPSGLSGSALRRRAETLLQDWLTQRGQYGSAALCTGEQLDDVVFALSQLIALAKSTTIRELAAILLDKTCFTLALHSHQGIVEGNLLDAGVSLGRLFWGAGVFNQQLWAVVGLADSGYEMPAMLAEVAQAPTEAQWLQECHMAQDGSWAINRVAYRTQDYLLSSVQNFAPNQHVRAWQASLSATAWVSVNHPAHCGHSPADRPNFWHGNGSLPRMAQWRATLVALYNLPADDWLGYTHAYFPCYAFDEYRLVQNWAFARVGTAYLALTASTPLTLITHGAGAQRELRTPGPQTVWLCQSGSQREQGDFAAFQAAILTAPPRFDALTVDYTTINRDQLAFDWQGSLLVNGQVQPVSDAPHYATPYCTVDFPARTMPIRVGDYLLQLDFDNP